MALGIRKLSASLNLPFDETYRAVNIFSRFADVPAGADIMEASMLRKQFTDCLSYVLQMKGASSAVSEDITEGCFQICDRNGNGTIDAQEFCIWYASASFTKEMLLDEETQRTRRFAEQNGIAPVDIDRYKSYFDKFDEDGSGAIEYEEFVKIVSELWKIPKNVEIPQSRMMNFWKMADLDGGGSLDFEEFVLFYVKYCESAGADPVEDFYRAIRRV